MQATCENWRRHFFLQLLDGTPIFCYNVIKVKYGEENAVFHIEFYTLPNGRKPVEDFLNSLSSKMRAKALYDLSVLEEYGNALREPYSKSIGDGLFELRIKFARDITRIFYFFVVGNRIVVTNGFVKKSMKTPPLEIVRARDYKADYERRFLHE